LLWIPLLTLVVLLSVWTAMSGPFVDARCGPHRLHPEYPPTRDQHQMTG
jgi:hypothetical protein